MPATPPRILSVEDDADCREMLRALLKSARIEVTAVATSTHALSFMKTESFDLYLLDAWMPDLSGFELCRRIRAFDPHTPILFFSGAAYEADKERGFEAGASGYVLKPDIDDLLLKVKQFVLPAAESNTPDFVVNQQLNRSSQPRSDFTPAFSLQAEGS